MCRDWNPPIKTTITTAGLLYLTLSLPNTKRNCYYTLDRQFRSESIMGQFQTLHTLSVKNSHHTVPPPSSPGSTAPRGPGPPQFRSFTIPVTHTTLGRTPLDEWSARRRDLYLAIYNANRKHTSMRPAGFEPKTQHASGRRPTSGHSDWRSQIHVLIQFPCPRFSQLSLSKWYAHQDTVRINLPIKPAHPALRDMFVLIPLSVLFKDTSSGHIRASEADEWKWVWSTRDMMTSENRVPLSICPPYVSNKMDSDKTWASEVRRHLRHGMGLLTLILPTWRIWWVPNNASKWQLGFNSALKGLKLLMSHYAIFSLLHWIRVSLSVIRQKVSKRGRRWPHEYWATLFKTSRW
jgi:hypothetical protein